MGGRVIQLRIQQQQTPEFSFARVFVRENHRKAAHIQPAQTQTELKPQYYRRIHRYTVSILATTTEYEPWTQRTQGRTQDAEREAETQTERDHIIRTEEERYKMNPHVTFGFACCVSCMHHSSRT